MKSPKRNLILIGLTLFAFLGGMVQGQSQTTVTVDTNRTWIGYMNWSPMPGDASGYGGTGGGVWGTADLRAYFTPTAIPPGTLTITPNTNVYNPTDHYWVNADGSGANQMDASFYVQDDTLAGQTLTFNGSCITNSLVVPFACVAFIKDFNAGYGLVNSVTVPVVSGAAFSLNLATLPGDHIQYGFETIGPDVSPALLASYGQVLIAQGNADPSLATLASQVVVEGQSASFAVTPVGTAPFGYQWASVDMTTTPPTTNNLSNGGRISGATTNRLTISSVTASDAGIYSLTVTNKHGTNSASASLVVLPLAQARTNILIDPSFELGLVDNNGGLSGWDYFTGSVLQSTNNYYYFTATPVNVLDGTNCVQVYDGGPYDGIFQDRPATPGCAYIASANFYCPFVDPITPGYGDVTYLEVHFMDGAGNVLIDYKSSLVDSSTIQDTWFGLQPTNMLLGDFVTQIGTSSYMVAPAGTAKVRFQITMASGGGYGSVYVDQMDLKLVEPTVTASVSGANIQLAFPTLYGPTYNVLFKNNLNDATWSLLASIVGDGTVKTVADPRVPAKRFYIVNTQ